MDDSFEMGFVARQPRVRGQMMLFVTLVISLMTGLVVLGAEIMPEVGSTVQMMSEHVPLIKVRMI